MSHGTEPHQHSFMLAVVKHPLNDLYNPVLKESKTLTEMQVETEWDDF